MSLTGQAPSGTSYRLRDATITVTGPGYSRLWSTEDDPDRTALSADIGPGAYTVALADGWRVERSVQGTATTIPAQLRSPNPASFTNTGQQRITVPLQFDVDGGDVNMSPGYDITLTVKEAPPALLVVANLAAEVLPATPSIEVFRARASGDALPVRTIRGVATTLARPLQVVVAGRQLIVLDALVNQSAIDMFSLDDDGNAAPTRRIVSTSLLRSLAVSNGELYVAATSTRIDVYALDSTSSQPVRSLTMADEVTAIAVDRGELFAGILQTSNGHPTMQVYAASGSGVVTPLRSFTASVFESAVRVSSIVIRGNEIIVADGYNGAIPVFPRDASGNVSPLRAITGFVGLIDDIASIGDELYIVAGFPQPALTNQVAIFPVTANGRASPSRVIAGPSTNLHDPVALGVVAVTP